MVPGEALANFLGPPSDLPVAVKASIGTIWKLIVRPIPRASAYVSCLDAGAALSLGSPLAGPAGSIAGSTGLVQLLVLQRALPSNA